MAQRARTHREERSIRARATLALSLALAAPWALSACGSSGGGADGGLDARGDGALDASSDRGDLRDGADPDAGCASFAGAYSLTTACIPLSGGIFSATCVTQSGCDVTLVGGGMTLRGTAHGAMVSLAAPDAPGVAVTLVQTSSGLAVRYTNSASGLVCSGSAGIIGVPTATSYCCDAVSQNCAAGERCTIVVGGNNALISACLPPLGAAPAGASCTREMGMVGFDMCARGLFCANTGQPSREARTCHAYCSNATQCGANGVCYNLSGVSTVGVCTPGCTLGGSECGAGMTCRYSPALDASGAETFATICDPVGTTAHGAACADSANCMAGDTCANTRMGPRCLTICDAHTPCPTGQTCTAFLPGGTPNPPGQGSCQ